MKIRLLITTLFVIPSVAIAQSISISGIVRDSHTQEPISYASIYLLSYRIGKMSDSSGSFSFRTNNLTTDTLVVSYVESFQFQF